MALYLNMHIVSVKTFLHISHFQPTMRSVPFIDDQDFLAGTVDMSVLPLGLTLRKDVEHKDMQFAFKISRECSRG
jgi:hypothetical protein